VPDDAIAIAIDTGLAAFRTIKLPALDESKIGDIIKFEVEGQLPQWNIDDVIVDFMTLDSTDKETSLLVTAVQKSSLKRELDTCSAAGIEALDAELEATAMVNAALAADVCHVDEAQVLVHIGDTSTAVVVMDGGKLRAMRAIHIGALTHEPGATAAESSATAEGGETADAAPAVAALSSDELARRLENAVARIRRELGRTLSGARTAHPIKAVYVCGWEVPNLIGTQVLDIARVRARRVRRGLRPARAGRGAAGRGLRRRAAPARRRHDPRFAAPRGTEVFTGTLERLEMPLAIAVSCSLVTWLAIVFNLFEHERLRTRGQRTCTLWLHEQRELPRQRPQGRRGAGTSRNRGRRSRSSSSTRPSARTRRSGRGSSSCSRSSAS
jgi:hypothetical protein